MKKKQYQSPILRVMAVDTDQQMLMSSGYAPGTGGKDNNGTSQARGNYANWDDDEF